MLLTGADEGDGGAPLFALSFYDTMVLHGLMYCTAILKNTGEKIALFSAARMIEMDDFPDFTSFER